MPLATEPAFTIEPATAAADRKQCYRIRMMVFVDEQGVPVAEEIDAHDETDAEHVLGLEDGRAVGTARAVPYDGALKVGRVAVLQRARGRGYGAALIRHFVDEARARGVSHVVLDAQTDAMGFYERLGFAAEGPVFDDAGIPHRRMTLVLA